MHNGRQGGAQGTAADLELQAAEILRLRGQVDDILAAHTGRSREQLRADTDRDLVLTAHQAVAYGIADTVITTLKPPRAPSAAA